MEDSLARLASVERVQTDLNIGKADIWFRTGFLPATADELVRAVRLSGFTPIKVVIGDKTTAVN